jgi:thiol-disulfide isomerase/thioredoxin
MTVRVMATAAAVLVCAGAVMAQQDAKAEPVAKPAEAAPAEGASKAGTLSIGDKAPALSIDTWVKGEPVKSFEAGRVYVVEFWATWCGPCRASIPHLTEMQAKHKDKKLTVIGVSSSERKGLADVKPFVEKMGDKMAYTVAWDDKGKTNKAYMDASGQEGIPTSFVVDQQGRVAWIGHPMDGLDKVVEQVIAGTYDVKKAAEEARRRAELEAKVRPHMEAFGEAYQSQDFKGAIAALDKAMAIDPVGLAEMSVMKFQILALQVKDLDKAYAYARETVDGAGKDNAQVLNAISWMILDDEGITRRDLPLARRAAERANELTQGKDPAIMDTFARALFDSGERDRAIQVQTDAVKLAPEGPMKEELDQRLKEYLKRAGKS